jgi:PAS domain S-box-containing protein
MKTKMNISIKQRIYLSFLLLVCLFVLNGIVTILTINSNKKLAINIFNVLRPSIQSFDDFKTIMLESKMYTTNWVFLRSNLEDKSLLKKLHDSDYIALKSRVNLYCSQWLDKNWNDSLNRVYSGFEELLAIEKKIMGSLKVFKDYDDPVIKLEAERKVEEEILPRTIALMNSLKAIHDFGVNIREEEGVKLERSSMKLRMLIVVLTITIIIAGFLLSIYMTKVIIGPVNRIRHIINNLGRGIIQKIDQKANDDEIGKMVLSVNNLSEKLQATATFAQEVGLRNFDIPFKPLSDEDTLGTALITMRGNLSESERQLLKVSQRLQLATHAAKVGIWDFDIVNNTLFWDEEMYRLYGIRAGEFSRAEEAWEARLHADDLQRIQEEVQKAIRGEKEYDTEFKIVWPDKSIHYIKANASVHRDESGNPLRMIGTNWDITGSRMAEKALNLAQFTVDNATHAIYWIKPDGSFYNLNYAAFRMLGYSYDELMQLSIPDIDSFYNKEKWPVLWEDLRDKKSISLITKQRRKDGVLIDTQVDAHYFMFDNMEMNCAFVYDITQRKLNEESLKKSEAGLEIKNKELEQKNKELEQFAYVASHDLQEPLRTTSSFVELFQQQYHGKLDEKADKYLDYIVQASERMKTFIIDLLEYSRIGSKKELKQVDCNIVLNEVLADLNTAIHEADAEIETGPLPVISGYQTEIKQLFQNLAFNAIKFRQKNIAPRIKITARREKDNWQFAFTDNGIGIAKEHNERIFVIFQRLHTRNEYKGSGIGLSHCKKIVELHKGKIWLESELGKGTTFYFTIPQNNN